MSPFLPALRVGDPQSHGSLSVFPIFSESNSAVEYRLSDAALADQCLLIEEVSEGGSVPDLLVENQGDVRVLFLEAEELVGAKQNRVLNTSVLVPAHAKIKIPVSCVEQGRWRYQSRYFGSSGSHAPSKLRRTLKASVSRSIKEGRGHRSDQSEVWKEVDCLHAAQGIKSDTAAMADAFQHNQKDIDAFREKLKYVEGASGVVVAIGERIVSVDLFDKPATCRRVWDRLLTGGVLDALETCNSQQRAAKAEVERLLTGAGELPWERAVTVGEGEEYRSESGRGDHGSALAFQDTLVHGSILTAV